jgi:hypothetical protein
MSSSTHIETISTYQVGAIVVDVADPDRRGEVISVASDVSNVRFDDGVERSVPHDRLCAVEAVHVDDGLSELNPSHSDQIIRRGQEAFERLRRVWPDWMAIAEALQLGRAEVMRELHTNSLTGRRYEEAMAKWLAAHSFETIDKGTRHRLLECLQHKIEIETWRSGLTESERQRFNHPDTVLRRWKKATAAHKEELEPKLSPYKKLEADHMAVIEERDRMTRAIERGGGDLWNADDRAEDLARFMRDTLGEAKAKKVARAILDPPKESDKS